MDALSDVREDYLRGMLEDDGTENAAGKVSGTVMVSALPIQKHAGGYEQTNQDRGRKGCRV